MLEPTMNYWLTTSEAAKLLKLTRQTIHDWISRGVIDVSDVRVVGEGRGKVKLIRDEALKEAERKIDTRKRPFSGRNKGIEPKPSE